MRQMITGAGCVGLVDMRAITALNGPLTSHVAQCIVPKSTFGHVSFRVYKLIKKKKINTLRGINKSSIVNSTFNILEVRTIKYKMNIDILNTIIIISLVL